MKHLQRRYCIILALMLFAFPRCFAEESLFRNQELDYIQSAASINGILYICTEDSILTFDATNASEGTYPLPSEADGFCDIRLFSSSEQLFALTRNDRGEHLCGRLTFLDGESHWETVYTLDWGIVQGAMTSEEDAWPQCVVGCKDDAVFTVQQGWTSGGLFSLDLTDGTISQLAGADYANMRISACGESAFLMQQSGFQTDASGGAIAMYDPEEKRLSPVDLPDRPSLHCMAVTDDEQEVYYLDGNRLIVRNLAGGTPETRGNLTNDGSYEQGFLLGDSWYAAVGRHKFAICPIQTVPDEKEHLVYFYDQLRAIEAEEKWMSAGSRIDGITGEETAAQLMDMLLTGDNSIDVFILSADTELFRAMRDRGYALPLSDSKLLIEATQRMYPDVLRQLSGESGDLIAIPIDVTFELPALNRSAMDRLGLSEEDIPSNWVDFLDWLDALAPALNHAQITLFPKEVPAEEARWQLIMYVLSTYQLYVSENPTSDAHTLQNLLERLEKMDFTRMGLLPRSELSTSDEDPSGLENSLFQPMTGQESLGYLIGDNVSQHVYPLCMALSPEAPAYLKLNVEAALVNPHTRFPERAISFAEMLWECTSPEVAISLQPQNNNYVEAADFQENEAFFRDYLAELAIELENAEEIDRPPILDRIADVEAEYEQLLAHRWSVDDETLQWLRAHDDHIIISEAAWLQDKTSGISDLVAQYHDGLIASSEFAEKLHAQLKMMQLEQ